MKLYELLQVIGLSGTHKIVFSHSQQVGETEHTITKYTKPAETYLLIPIHQCMKSNNILDLESLSWIKLDVIKIVPCLEKKISANSFNDVETGLDFSISLNLTVVVNVDDSQSFEILKKQCEEIYNFSNH